MQADHRCHAAIDIAQPQQAPGLGQWSVQGVVDIFGNRTPRNNIFTAVVCCLVIGLLWLLVNRTRTGKAVLAASMNPRGVALLGL